MTTIITNTRGSTVVSVDDRTADVTTPLTIVGKNYAGYGQAVFGDMYALMENFADSSPPADPAEGMLWYDSTVGRRTLSFFDGASWVGMLSVTNSMGGQLSLLGTASSIDLTATGSIDLHVVPTNNISLVSSILLIPHADTDATGNVHFSLEVDDGTNDVMDPVVAEGFTGPTRFGYFPAFGVNRIAAAGETIKLVVSAAAVGTLTVDAYLFGQSRES